jgi:pyruvate,water dikinase
MEIIKGKPASPGKVFGKIKVINKYEDINNIEYGDIVVAEAIHPDMSFICLKIKGIIVQEGSLLQHACIIAREFHIPCIVKVKDCTKIFKNGEIVELDGNSGIIIKKKSIF